MKTFMINCNRFEIMDYSAGLWSIAYAISGMTGFFALINIALKYDCSDGW